MDKEKIISIVTEKFKLVRTENNYTQDKMAEVLGISKKHLFKSKNNEPHVAGQQQLHYVPYLEKVQFYKMQWVAIRWK